MSGFNVFLERNQVRRIFSLVYHPMAVAVVSGQIYIGTGYREMAEATNGADIRVTCEVVPPYTPSAKKFNASREFE